MMPHRVPISVDTDHGLLRRVQIEEFATKAYVTLTQWFDEPTDASWKCHLCSSRFAAMGRDSFKKEYIIGIPRRHTSVLQDYATISHEMYHRITHLRGGLRKIVWVDEMLAVRASYHVLVSLGYEDYASYSHNLRASSRPLPLAKVLACKRRRIFPGIFGFGYPKLLGESVRQLGATIEDSLDWSAMISIVKSENWEDWLDGLSPLQAHQAVQILPFLKAYFR